MNWYTGLIHTLIHAQEIVSLKNNYMPSGTTQQEEVIKGDKEYEKSTISSNQSQW
jgi:hypothetical protein